MNWFKEEWLSEEHKAIGAYIRILYTYFGSCISKINYYESFGRRDLALVMKFFYSGKEFQKL